MPVIRAPYEFHRHDLFVDLSRVVGRALYLKCEGFNFAGSVLLETATAMVEAAEHDGRLHPGATLVESSSGDLGVALAMVAASRGYAFVCVTDPRCSPASRGVIEALGGRVDTVMEPDPVEGFLGARLDHVARLCATEPDHVRLDRYVDDRPAHHRGTGPAILDEFPGLDVLFVDAGATASLTGCARHLRDHRPSARIVAVGAAGSVSSGRRPLSPQLDTSVIDDVVRVEAPAAVLACHRMAARGYLFGASTGTVVSGALAWLAAHGDDATQAVAVAPDLGGRSLDTVYDPTWVAAHLGDDLHARVGADRAVLAGASIR